MTAVRSVPQATPLGWQAASSRSLDARLQPNEKRRYLASRESYKGRKDGGLYSRRGHEDRFSNPAEGETAGTLRRGGGGKSLCESWWQF